MSDSKYWTAAHSWTYGCHQGNCSECDQCWAAALVHRWERNPKMSLVPGHLTRLEGTTPRWTGAVQVLEPRLFTIKGRSQVIACNWIGDLFHARVPREVIWRALDQVALNIYERQHWGEPHAYLFLTHQPARMVLEVLAWLGERLVSLHETDDMIDLPRGDFTPTRAFKSAVWWGATVTRLGALHAAHEITMLPGNHWLSVEPIESRLQLGPIYSQGIDWVAAGTSTTDRALQGSKHIAMVQELVADCRERNIPVWVKQLGLGMVGGYPAHYRQMPESLRRAFNP